MTRFAAQTIALLLLAIAAGQSSLGQQPAPGVTASQPPVALPAKESFRLYLLMGQSNMAGRDTSTLATQTTDPRVLAMTIDGRWLVAKDPIHQKDGRIEPGVGPGISFAREMIKTDPTVTIGLVPCAVGGTPLKRWQKGGDLYERALSRAKLAAQSGVLAGGLWLQGETDADQQASADSYEARLSQMLKDLRLDLGQPNLPIVVGQIGYFLPLDKHPFVETVHAAIRKVPADVSNVGYADSAGLPDKGDKLHYSAGSQVQLGARFADAMQKLSN